jgi:hypothetical protein
MPAHCYKILTDCATKLVCALILRGLMFAVFTKYNGNSTTN